MRTPLDLLSNWNGFHCFSHRKYKYSPSSIVLLYLILHGFPFEPLHGVNNHIVQENGFDLKSFLAYLFTKSKNTDIVRLKNEDEFIETI